MDSLFNTNFESTPSPHNLPTVKLKAHTYELQESNVRLKVSNYFTIYIKLYKYDLSMSSHHWYIILGQLFKIFIYTFKK